MPLGGPGLPQQRPGPPGAAPGPKPTSELPVGDKVPSKPASRNATPGAQKAPTPPIESKPSVAEAIHAPTAPMAAQRSGRVVPAIPMAAPRPAVAMNNGPAPGAPGSGPAANATSAAAAAVAAAMAKLPPPGSQQKPRQPNMSVDAMTQQMHDMRPYDTTRGRGGHQHRGGRGGPRPQHQHKKIEVPQSDYDFQTANAKFNKQDLVKEAIATGSPAAEAEAHSHDGDADLGSDSGVGHTSNYNRGSSFFDNISSEARDREENAIHRLGGREWRGEEEKRNIETFGQGSVDGNRGRGRGRGRGYGRGFGPMQGHYAANSGYAQGPMDVQGNQTQNPSTENAEGQVEGSNLQVPIDQVPNGGMGSTGYRHGRPEGPGVEGAPAAPRAMRQGLPNTSVLRFSGRAS